MDSLDIPEKITTPFANGGDKNIIPVTPSATPGRASFNLGFPPLTRTPLASGGIPPSGMDMNGILYDVTAIQQWQSAGGGFPYDGAFSTDIGGYPKGARIQRADGMGYWLNTTDNNTVDPESAESAAAGWVPDTVSGISPITMTSADVTLTPSQYGKPIITINGTLTANLNLIFPTGIAGKWNIINATTGNFTITAKTASGTGVTLTTGIICGLFGNGTNIYQFNAGSTSYDSTMTFAANTVGFELNKRKSVFSTGVAATDVANIQAAVNAATPYTIIELFGTVSFQTNSTITLKPNVWLRFNGVSVTHTNSTSDLFAYTPGTPTGYPGRIVIENLVAIGPGTGGTSTAFKIDANAPFCTLRGCFLAAFNTLVYLRDAYSSVIDQCLLTGAQHGIKLLRESHAVTVRDTFVDNCSVAAFSINYGGGAGTGATHNVQLIGGAYQNSGVGVWAENAYGLHTVGLYHEGNTVNDYRLGVADAGAYLRPCYGAVIDGFESASPCGSGKNIQIEHAIGIEVRGATWNTGCSTTSTLVSYDGFSDRIDIDVFRYSTTTPTATAPADFTVDPTRGVLRYRGRYIFSDAQTDAIQFGNLANITGRIYKGYTNGGRNALTVESRLEDLQLRVPQIMRMQDGSGNDLLQVDALNNLVIALKPFRLSGQTVGTTVGAAGGASALPATPLGYLNTQINGVSVRIPYYN